MFVTLVAGLCRVLPGGPGDCVEESVTDSNQSNITFQSCMIQGQIGIAKWMSEHPIYHANWTLQRYKCAPGHYELHVKARPMKKKPRCSESDQADTQGADEMSDHDEWISCSHWGMFPLERKSSN